MKISRMFLVLVTFYGTLLAQQGNENQGFFDTMKAKSLEIKAKAIVQASIVKEALGKKFDEATEFTKESFVYAKSFFNLAPADQEKKSDNALLDNASQDISEKFNTSNQVNPNMTKDLTHIQATIKNKSFTCIEYLRENMLITGTIITTVSCVVAGAVYYVYTHKKAACLDAKK